MGRVKVERLFARLPDLLAEEAKLAIFGTFKYGRRFNSKGNAAVDGKLRAEAGRRVNILAAAAIPIRVPAVV
jgi:hypothetical protein